MKWFILPSFFLVLSGWERIRPGRSQSWDFGRWSANLGLGIINVVAVFLFPGGSLFFAYLASLHSWGWLRNPPQSLATEWIVSILVLDLAVYLQHVAFHRISFFWNWHRVHHADPLLDISSGVRFHPLEALLSFFWKGGVVLALGCSPSVALGFEIWLALFSFFTHANIQMPRKLEKGIRFLWVTPDMHLVHHSVREEQNRNFGFGFSFWDRLFRTYQATFHSSLLGPCLGLSKVDAKTAASWRWILWPFGTER